MPLFDYLTSWRVGLGWVGLDWRANLFWPRVHWHEEHWLPKGTSSLLYLGGRLFLLTTLYRNDRFILSVCWSKTEMQIEDIGTSKTLKETWVIATAFSEHWGNGLTEGSCGVTGGSAWVSWVCGWACLWCSRSSLTHRPHGYLSMGTLNSGPILR